MCIRDRFFGLTGWRLPDPVESALASIGSINTPMAMMIIGASLAHSDIRAAFTNPRLYRVALDRKSTRLNSSHSDRSRMPSSA